jgi:hypothetical protein
VKRSRRAVVSAALCGLLVLIGWLVAALGSFGLPGSTGARTEISGATSAITRAVGHAVAMEEGPLIGRTSGKVGLFDEPPTTPSNAPEPLQNVDRRAAVSADTSLTKPQLPSLAPSTAPVSLAGLNSADQVPNAAPSLSGAEALDPCRASDACIDQYLWSLYVQTPKMDTMKEEERVKSKVKFRGKVRTVIKSLIKYVSENFAWKDPKAAQMVGMSVQDYVIGGMEPSFRRKLYSALRAMNEAGFSPGITSGFRDNYRQEIATGNKAASDSSYHGGSRRGGYGHGLAADLVSVKGDTRAERYASSNILWKWIDEHERELGIGRPYLDKDPPHVAPIDGQEYADKRKLKTRLSGLNSKSK